MALYKAFTELKGLVISRPDSIDVINTTFRLHKLTAIILIGCTILISCKQYIGENIHCYHTSEMMGVMFNSYCFMKATFSLPVEGKSHHMTSHHGVYQGDHHEDPDNIFHNYYQWVCYVLFFQAVAFYVPYIFWKTGEKGRLKKLIEKIDHDPLREAQVQVEAISRFLADKSGKFDNYATTFFCCQIANLLNVVGQIFFIDYFLGGQFFSYGFSFITDSSNYLVNMATVFPKVTKCTMKIFGVSGKIVYHAGICILPVNVVNEKIYVFLYFWLMALAFWTTLSVLKEIFVLAFPSMRRYLLLKRSGSVPSYNVRKILNHSTYGDFIVLLKISDNIEPSQFEALLVGLGEKLSVQHKVSSEPEHKNLLNQDGVDQSVEIKVSKEEQVRNIV